MQKFYEAYQFYGYRESEIGGGVLTTANQGIRGDTPLIVTYSEKRFFEWHEDEKSVSLRAASGSYGGGSEVLVVGTITTNTYQVITNGDEPIAPILSSDAHRGGGVAVVTYQTATGTLSPGAHPGSYNGQDAYNDMFITERMSSVDKLGWSASRSNTNDEQCGRSATDAGQRKL